MNGSSAMVTGRARSGPTLAVACDLVDVFTDEGQARLREVNPQWKVPTAVIEGEVVFDSRQIVERLISRYGSQSTLSLRDSDDSTDRDTIAVSDGTLDALISVIYLGRDGVDAGTSSYVGKQVERAQASMAWLETRVEGVWLTAARTFGVAELALCTAMGWMRFRERYAIEDHPALMRCFEHHDARESLAQTRPPG